jgi:hypothetical protein
LSASWVAHISAVAPRSFTALGSAPRSSNSVMTAASAYSTAYMSGVVPPGPRCRAAAGFSISCRRTAARSRRRSASISLVAPGLGDAGGASPATSSGHSAPSSIHRLIVSICSGASGPAGGICCPNRGPRSFRYMRLVALLPGISTGKVPPRSAALRRSSRNPFNCCAGPWQPMQCSRRIGCTSRRKSTRPPV